MERASRCMEQHGAGATLKNNGPSVAGAVGNQAMRQAAIFQCNASSHGIISTLIVFLMDAIPKMPRELKQAFLFLLQCKIISKPLQSSSQGRKHGLCKVIHFSSETHIHKENKSFFRKIIRIDCTE